MGTQRLQKRKDRLMKRISRLKQRLEYIEAEKEAIQKVLLIGIDKFEDWMDDMEAEAVEDVDGHISNWEFAKYLAKNVKFLRILPKKVTIRLKKLPLGAVSIFPRRLMALALIYVWRGDLDELDDKLADRHEARLRNRLKRLIDRCERTELALSDVLVRDEKYLALIDGPMFDEVQEIA